METQPACQAVMVATSLFSVQSTSEAHVDQTRVAHVEGGLFRDGLG
jgi:hypothetical protein